MLGLLISSLGHLYCSIFLFVAASILERLEWLVWWTVDLVGVLTNSQAGLDTPQFPLPSERTEPLYCKSDVLDETEMLAASEFPIKPEELIERAKILVQAKFGLNNPSLLSKDFLMIYPCIGPLTKPVFLDMFTRLQLDKAFQGSSNFFSFSVDPMEPNRVWFFSRSELLHEGVFLFGNHKMKPTGKKVVSPPQVLSLTFNSFGEVSKLTGGYSVDRSVGNTGGVGGLFGLVHGVGGSLPFPESRPWTPSMKWEVFTYHLPKLWRKGLKL